MVKQLKKKGNSYPNSKNLDKTNSTEFEVPKNENVYGTTSVNDYSSKISKVTSDKDVNDKQNEKEDGSHANADPNAEIKKSNTMISNVFFLPNLSHGYEPSRAPITVPQRAIDIIKTP